MGRDQGRRRSLRSAITVITFGLLASTLVLSFIGYQALQHASDTRIARFEQTTTASTLTSELLMALVNQEAGLRGYLSTGKPSFLEPLRSGELDERRTRSNIWVALEALDDPELKQRMLALVGAIDDWHRTIAGPQITQRDDGALVDLPAALLAGKAAFDRIRSAHAPVMASIRAIAAGHAEDTRKTELLIRVLLVTLMLTVLVVALLGTRYLLRNTVRPLAELAQRAERHQGFPAPRSDEPIREVHALSRALSQLDDTVRVREAELAQLHGDAVALAKFGEYVQQLSDEEELHDSLERVIHQVSAPSQTNIMIRNASKNRLEVVRPPLPIEDQTKHPILNEPIKCRAVRTLREVSANSDSSTACRCELGVPKDGSYLCVPMLAAGELIGVTNLQSAERDHFPPATAQAVQGYTGFASATVSSLRLIAATRERALRDGLTGAYNRAFLGEYLAKTLAMARRRSTTFGVLMVDLDHFKKINDVHGHLVGDQAIVAREVSPGADPRERCCGALWRRGVRGPADRCGPRWRDADRRADPRRGRIDARDVRRRRAPRPPPRQHRRGDVPDPRQQRAIAARRGRRRAVSRKARGPQPGRDGSGCAGARARAAEDDLRVSRHGHDENPRVSVSA